MKGLHSRLALSDATPSYDVRTLRMRVFELEQVILDLGFAVVLLDACQF